MVELGVYYRAVFTGLCVSNAPFTGWWGRWGPGRGDLDGHRETPRIRGPGEKSLSPIHCLISYYIIGRGWQFGNTPTETYNVSYHQSSQKLGVGGL